MSLNMTHALKKMKYKHAAVVGGVNSCPSTDLLDASLARITGEDKMPNKSEKKKYLLNLLLQHGQS